MTNRTVLMPIKPIYANAIMRGDKLVEFRKTTFSEMPEYVVVYASSPVKKVLGYFDVGGVERLAIDELWSKYGLVGCIEYRDFRDYYSGKDYGVAIKVRRVSVLENPVNLSDIGYYGRPPQSYCYVRHDAIRRIDAND